MKTDIQILEKGLSVDACISFVKSSAVGGIAIFIGTVRNQTENKEVIRLEFEAYLPMALKEMNKIAISIGDRWEVLAVSIHHRVGSLVIGDIPVIIAVSAPHRKAAFESCQYAIDTLKKTVPIWKKEVFTDGETWVAAHP